MQETEQAVLLLIARMRNMIVGKALYSIPPELTNVDLYKNLHINPRQLIPGGGYYFSVLSFLMHVNEF